MSSFEEQDENETDWEDPDPSDQDDHDDPEAIPCPFCRKPVVENADICPHCGNYIFAEDAAPERKPVWLWVVVVLLIAMLSGLIYFFVR
jgi:hypothetical protein